MTTQGKPIPSRRRREVEGVRHDVPGGVGDANPLGHLQKRGLVVADLDQPRHGHRHGQQSRQSILDFAQPHDGEAANGKDRVDVGPPGKKLQQRLVEAGLLQRRMGPILADEVRLLRVRPQWRATDY